MPTGGVDLGGRRIIKKFANGAYCVGMGSKLMKKHADGSFDLEKIQALTAASLATIKKLRS